VLCNKCHAKD